MIRMGILSTAKIGVQFVLPAIQQANHACISAIASRNGSRAAKLAKSLNVAQSYDNYDAILQSDDIDAVYIPLPTSQHVEWSLKAAAAGKHVLCEKPIALHSSDIKKLIKARDRYGVVLSEAFMVTYHPQWLKVRELIAKGRIGELRHVQGSFSYFNVDPENMRNRPELGGGVLPDIGVYPTVCTRYVTGLEPTQVQATVNIDENFKTDWYSSVKASFPGFELSFYVSTQMAQRQQMVFHGTKGFIEVNAPFNSNIYEGSEVRLHNVNHKEFQSFYFTNTNQYVHQIDAFAQEVKRSIKGTPPAKQRKGPTVFTLEDSLHNQRVIDAIYASGQKQGAWKKLAK